VHIGSSRRPENSLHIDVGENSIAWFEDEIDDYLEMKAAERDAKAAARAKVQA
jgi:hypothetical protein